MGHSTDGLTFNVLRGANLARLPEFKNSRGEIVHSESDGSDWSPSDWMTAVCGEVGEAANIIKKHKRGDISLAESVSLLEDEFADIVIYLDILAVQCGINLGRAVTAKFNKVSERVNSRVYIGSDGDWHYRNI